VSEERLLRDLARVVAEHERELARLEAGCLNAATATSPMEAEMLKPLGADFRTAIVARLSQDLAPAPSQVGRSAPRTGDAAQAPSHGMLAGLSRFLDTLMQRPALGLGACAAAVIAAVLGLGLLRVQPGGALALPGYEMTLQGKASMRGDEPAGRGPVAFVPGDGFQLLLRPKNAPGGAIVAQAFVRVGEDLAPLSAPAPRVLDSGVVLIEGQVGEDVLLPAGLSRVVAVVARPGALPNAAELQKELSGRDEAFTDEWHAWTVDVVLNP